MAIDADATKTEAKLEMRWGTRLASHAWVGPIIACGLSLLTLGTLLWFLHQHDINEHAKDFDSDVESALQSVRLHLRGDEEYVTLLASELARGAVDAASFQEKASQFVADNPEVVNILWADDGFVIRWVAPHEPNKQVVGLTLSLPEPERASRLAKRSRNPAYTRVLEVIQGYPALEIYTPVYRGEIFLGVVGAVYSCDKILRHTVPPDVLESNRVSLLTEENGAGVSSISLSSHLDSRFVRTVDLSPFGHGIMLRLERYETDFFDTGIWLLVLLCAALTLGMAYSMWALAREAEERRTTQEVVQRERDNLVNVFEAMEDGVAIVTPRLDLQYVNPALVQDFGPYENRKCYEYFHGHAAPCSWCMMEDVVAGRTVHTEWCYPRNEKTYDLIDTRVNNPDGSISKLKIFRDITERVEGAKALEESEQRFHLLFERAAEVLFLHDLAGGIVDVNQRACDTLGYTRDEFRALTLSEIQVGDSADPLKDLAHTLSLRTRYNPATLHARYRRKNGSAFPVEVRLGTIDYRGQQLILASARDVTQREAAEQAIKRQLQAEKSAAEQTRFRLEESESLHRVTAALLQKNTLAEVLDVVCLESQRLTGATGSGVLHLEDGHFHLTNWTGEPPPRVEHMPVAGSFAGLAVERGEPLFVPDLTRHDLACYRHPRPTSLIAVPLGVGGNVIGVLDVAGGAGAFESGDIRILNHFADQAAIAIEKARLREQAEQGAVLEERHRLARELHDSVSQDLFSAALYADAASLEIASEHHDLAAEHMETVKALVREAMLEMRILIFELHPPVLEKAGLVGAIETRMAAVEARAGLETEVSVIGDETRLPVDVEEALYGFAQEALNNAHKHSNARSIRVRAHFQPASVTLEVVDDGTGFDRAKADRSGGMGLRSMRERLERLGGRLGIESSPGGGAKLTAEVAV
jgi:PAS domain S-box-containing protein